MAAPRRRPARAARSWAAPISPTASRPAARATRPTCAAGPRPISASSPPITTCSRPTSLTSASPTSSGKRRARRAATAQVAGGVPAMCDGVTQGEAGMELSLFSRDVIALATGVALSHQMFDAALYLGVCDKIVPGLVIGALAFGHLPAIFVPAGPMTSGLPNDEKAKHPPALRGGEGGPRRAAGGGVAVLSRARHLHLLRHGQHQPDADGDHGPAHARRLLRQPQHAAARRADPAPRRKRALEITALGNAYTPLGAGAGREGVRERHRRPQRHRRLHQPHDPPHRHGCGGRHHARPGPISPTSRT